MLPCGCQTVEHIRPAACARRGPALIITERCADHQAERARAIRAFHARWNRLMDEERACRACWGSSPNACSYHQNAREALL